jgi:hypothetical protein
MDFEAILVSDFAHCFVIAGPQISVGAKGKKHHHEVFGPNPDRAIGHQRHRQKIVVVDR